VSDLISREAAIALIDQLSEGQRAAICGRYAWTGPMEEDEGERGLYQLGLWNPRPKYGEQVITPLGKQIRAIILKARELAVQITRP